ALVFPALFALGVLGIDRYAEGVHLDLDATIYGEIAFTPFRHVDIAGVEVARALLVLGAAVLINLVLVAVFWKELKVTTSAPEFARTAGSSPTLVSRLLLPAVAVTAVCAFESVGALLVFALLIVRAATARLLTDRLGATVLLAV